MECGVKWLLSLRCVNTTETPDSFVYFINDGTNAIKIGVAERPWDRLTNMQVGTPNKLKCIYLIPCKGRNSAYTVETLLHNNFEDFLIRGEWFSIMDKLNHNEFTKAFSSSKYWRKTVVNKSHKKINNLDIYGKHLSATQVSRLTGIDTKKIRELCRNNKIPHITYGNGKYIAIKTPLPQFLFNGGV